MKSSIWIITLLCFTLQATAQQRITGYVTAQPEGTPLEGATVLLEPGNGGTLTDANGFFSVAGTQNGGATLRIRYVGFAETSIRITTSADTLLRIGLTRTTIEQSEVEIAATRATPATGMAYTNLSARELEPLNTGRDLPYLLESVPSLVATSDAGNGVGYTGMRIRGSDPTRINVTLNDIPVNDAESQLVYWVDLPDLATSAQSIQVQRGAGTSTNGAGAFGGSVNIQTRDLSPVPFLNTTGSFGSFNTYKTNAVIGTGLLGEKWNFEGRLSAIGSDGYIDRASSKLRSLYISGGYFGTNDELKITVLSGKERTYQAWYGVPEAALDTNRTWNQYTYDNQVDDYQQDHYQLVYTHRFRKDWSASIALHDTHGKGYYEEYEADASFADYLLDDVIVGTDTIRTTDLVRRKWLDNQFYGTTWSVEHHPEKGLSLLFGGGYNEYDGDHFGEVIWAQYASNGTLPYEYYSNNGFKTDFNSYLKATCSFLEQGTVYGDVQVRSVHYQFTGYDDQKLPVEQTDDLLFFNPKAGITWTFTHSGQAYLSFSTANKEPSSDDYTESTPSSRPDPETLNDFECGYRYQAKKFSAGINYYLMMYKNQLVLTGAVNDVGNYTRTNVAHSTREGIELEWTWQIARSVTAAGNVVFGRSSIDEFHETYDDYDLGGQVTEIYRDKAIAFSPGTTGYAAVGWKPLPELELNLSGKYVGKQYLDNTESDAKSLDPWFTTDLRITASLHPKFIREVGFTLSVLNLFDELYESNGYTYSYISGGSKTTENYYYPQAGRNFMAQVALKF